MREDVSAVPATDAGLEDEMKGGLLINHFCVKLKYINFNPVLRVVPNTNYAPCLQIDDAIIKHHHVPSFRLHPGLIDVYTYRTEYRVRSWPRTENVSLLSFQGDVLAWVLERV